MRCHTVVLTISLSVGFLDSLHDPSAYVAPHDISEAAVPVYEHMLTAPRSNTQLSDTILNACRYERRLAEANANRNTFLSVRHFRGMTSSEDFPCTSTWGITAVAVMIKNRWRSHLGMILRSTGRSNRKTLTSCLMYWLAAGSYTQWRSTEAPDVRCENNVDGSSPSLKRCIM